MSQQDMPGSTAGRLLMRNTFLHFVEEPHTAQASRVRSQSNPTARMPRWLDCTGTDQGSLSHSSPKADASEHGGSGVSMEVADVEVHVDAITSERRSQDLQVVPIVTTTANVGVVEPTCTEHSRESTDLTFAANVGSVAQAGALTHQDRNDGTAVAGPASTGMGEPKTTVMLGNLPYQLTRDGLVSMLEYEGFRGRFDFIYLPTHFGSGHNFGYSFVNLVNEEEAEAFRSHFDGLSIRSDAGPGPQTTVRWSTEHQGLAANVERYRSSRLLHPEVNDGFKPAIFQDGVRMAFPPPRIALKRPRLRRDVAARTGDAPLKSAHSGQNSA